MGFGSIRDYRYGADAIGRATGIAFWDGVIGVGFEYFWFALVLLEFIAWDDGFEWAMGHIEISACFHICAWGFTVFAG